MQWSIVHPAAVCGLVYTLLIYKMYCLQMLLLWRYVCIFTSVMTLTLFRVWYLAGMQTDSVCSSCMWWDVSNCAMLCSAWRAQVIHHNSDTSLVRQTPVKHALYSEHVHQSMYSHPAFPSSSSFPLPLSTLHIYPHSPPSHFLPISTPYSFLLSTSCMHHVVPHSSAWATAVRGTKHTL